MTQAEKVKKVAKILKANFNTDAQKATHVAYLIVEKLEEESDKVTVTGGGA